MRDNYLNQFNVLYMITLKINPIHLRSSSILSLSFDWPGVLAGNHVLGDRWLWVQVSVHVWPSRVLGNLVHLGLVTVLFCHLCLLVC